MIALSQLCLGFVDKLYFHDKRNLYKEKTTHGWGSLEVTYHTVLIMNINSWLTTPITEFTHNVEEAVQSQFSRQCFLCMLVLLC